MIVVVLSLHFLRCPKPVPVKGKPVMYHVCQLHALGIYNHSTNSGRTDHNNGQYKDSQAWYDDKIKPYYILLPCLTKAHVFLNTNSADPGILS